jgi:hypothetical protein
MQQSGRCSDRMHGAGIALQRLTGFIATSARTRPKDRRELCDGHLRGGLGSSTGIVDPLELRSSQLPKKRDFSVSGQCPHGLCTRNRGVSPYTPSSDSGAIWAHHPKVGPPARIGCAFFFEGIAHAWTKLRQSVTASCASNPRMLASSLRIRWTKQKRGESNSTPLKLPTSKLYPSPMSYPRTVLQISRFAADGV